MEYYLNDESILTIKKATCTDAESLVNYCNQVAGESDFLTFGNDEFGVTVEEEEYFLKCAEDSKFNLSLIAVIDNNIVGHLNFRGNHRNRLAHVGEFGLSVLKTHWGKGIGKKLVENLIIWAKKNNVIKKINLQVLENNFKAISLYEKMGFKVEGRLTKNFYLNNKFYDSICMGLFLEQNLEIEYEIIEKNPNIQEISNLVLTSFDKYIAKDYSKDGQNTFYSFFNNGNLLLNILENKDFIIIAKEGKKIVGLLTTRGKTHISLLFVDENYHGRGIAKNLLNTLLKNSETNTLTVNSSPFGEKIYQQLGFSVTGLMTEKDGIKSIPMCLNTNGGNS